MDARSSNFGNELDFGTGANGNLRDPESAASVGTLFAENIHKYVGCTVGDDMLFGKSRGAVHENEQLYNPGDFVEVAERQRRSENSLASATRISKAQLTMDALQTG